MDISYIRWGIVVVLFFLPWQHLSPKRSYYLIKYVLNTNNRLYRYRQYHENIISIITAVIILWKSHSSFDVSQLYMSRGVIDIIVDGFLARAFSTACFFFRGFHAAWTFACTKPVPLLLVLISREEISRITCLGSRKPRTLVELVIQSPYNPYIIVYI